jgi:FKBP-type peptidyl-prolyl cis-trans isomerase FkpA
MRNLALLFTLASALATSALAQSQDEAKSGGKKVGKSSDKGAITTPSGLVYTELKRGTGPSPKETDRVTVNYRGTFTDGKEFDSSYKRNQPATFPLNGVIKCWTEGVQKMKVGGKAKLVCPSSIAYGDQGRPPLIPGGATLNFEVELLAIEK